MIFPAHRHDAQDAQGPDHLVCGVEAPGDLESFGSVGLRPLQGPLAPRNRGRRGQRSDSVLGRLLALRMDCLLEPCASLAQVAARVPDSVYGGGEPKLELDESMVSCVRECGAEVVVVALDEPERSLGS